MRANWRQRAALERVMQPRSQKAKKQGYTDLHELPEEVQQKLRDSWQVLRSVQHARPSLSIRAMLDDPEKCGRGL